MCETSGPLAVSHHGNRRRPTRSIMAGPRVDLGTFLSTGGARDPATGGGGRNFCRARAPVPGNDFDKDKTTGKRLQIDDSMKSFIRR